MYKIDDSELNKIVIGRVEPHIYSFETNTLPNLLKVGDTYRPVEERLHEWRKYYADLQEVSRHSAIVKDEVYFRDHAVHTYLKESDLDNIPLDKSKNIHSKEFFKDAKKTHIEDAIRDITDNYEKSPKYSYYDGLRQLTEYHHERTLEFSPRPNQQEVVNKFSSARKEGRTNLLMYAVMRFGKSITSMWCAKEMNAKITVVVSAKADVREEWKKTVESDKGLTGYRFMDARVLKRTPDILSVFGQEFELAGGTKEVCTNIVLFFTLQDLAGSSREIKKHHEILHGNSIDLLIIDETHFGARAPLLGKILTGIAISDEDKIALEKIEKEDDNGREDFGDIKKLNAIDADIKLHLSGTPYRILMGSEFEPEDIIAFVQFADIYREKIAWNEQNIDRGEVEAEWKNPYFGFPQMIRFAFNPNESSRKLLANINGASPADIFAPRYIKKDVSGEYRNFVHEQEVLELLQILDGTKQDMHMLSLLDHNAVRNGKLARHIVFALPYRASCDALEKLINEHATEFKNLSTYKIVNAAGYDTLAIHGTSENVKNAIELAEEKGKKTITLTVNKMLTGVTVPQWDTMIYLKSTMSPQDYDQAVFRLQSPWLKTYSDTEGSEIVRDMKPQTLLVDLYPTRMFQMQEQKALVYGINIANTGNKAIAENIKRDLEISPIIRINTEQGKLEEVTPTDIMDIVRQYESARAIADDVREIAVDISLMSNEELAIIISSYPELGSKLGILRIKPNEGEGSEMDGGDESEPANPDEHDPPLAPTNPNIEPGTDATKVNIEVKAFENKLRTIYLLVLLFAFLSTTEEKSFEDVINNLDYNSKNQRIAQNLSLKKHELELLRTLTNGHIERMLDYKIQNADVRAEDKSISPVERLDLAIHKFGKISDSEIFTPKYIVDKIYGIFEEDFWQGIQTNKVLDIASKSGSFANGYIRQVIARGLDTKNIANNFYSIPTSGAAYEFTRKTYETLGLNVDNIAEKITAYDLIDLAADEIKYLLSQDKKFCDITLDDLKGYNRKKDESEGNVKFAAVVGNPPYQVSDGGAQASAKPIYQHFVRSAKALDPKAISLIMPSRWYAGGKGLDSFRIEMLHDTHIKKLVDILTPEDVFPGANLRGGICYWLWDNSYSGDARVETIEHKVTVSEVTRPLATPGLDIFIRDNLGVSIISKVDSSNSLSNYISSRKPYGLSGYFIKDPGVKLSKVGIKKPIKIYGKNKVGYIARDVVSQGKDLIDTWKIFTARANNIGTELNDDNLNTIIGKPGEICTETYIVVGVGLKLDQVTTTTLAKYLKTKFARYMISLAKASHDAAKQTYQFVPVQDFTTNSDINWSKSVTEIDELLFDKYSLSQEERSFIRSRIKAME